MTKTIALEDHFDSAGAETSPGQRNDRRSRHRERRDRRRVPKHGRTNHIRRSAPRRSKAPTARLVAAALTVRRDLAESTRRATGLGLHRRQLPNEYASLLSGVLAVLAPTDGSVVLP